MENGRAGELGNGFPEMGVGRREPIREISGQMPAGPASVGRRKKRVSGLSDWREVGLDKTNHHSMSQVCDTVPLVSGFTAVQQCKLTPFSKLRSPALPTFLPEFWS